MISLQKELFHDGESAEGIINSDQMKNPTVMTNTRAITSSKVSNPPVWLKDYVTNVTNSMRPYSLANYLPVNTCPLNIKLI